MFGILMTIFMIAWICGVVGIILLLHGEQEDERRAERAAQRSAEVAAKKRAQLPSALEYRMMLQREALMRTYSKIA